MFEKLRIKEHMEIAGSDGEHVGIVDKVEGEYKELIERIKDLLDIIAREARVLGIIKAELLEIKEKYATPRMTTLAADEGEKRLHG